MFPSHYYYNMSISNAKEKIGTVIEILLDSPKLLLILCSLGQKIMISAPFLMPVETKILVLPSASVKRFGVSRMRDFFFFFLTELCQGGKNWGLQGLHLKVGLEDWGLCPSYGPAVLPPLHNLKTLCTKSGGRWAPSPSS